MPFFFALALYRSIDDKRVAAELQQLLCDDVCVFVCLFFRPLVWTSSDRKTKCSETVAKQERNRERTETGKRQETGSARASWAEKCFVSKGNEDDPFVFFLAVYSCCESEIFFCFFPLEKKRKEKKKRDAFLTMNLLTLRLHQ